MTDTVQRSPLVHQRWFGVTIGGALTGVAAIAWWRFSLPYFAIASAMTGLGTAIIYYTVPSTQHGILTTFHRITLPIRIVISVLLLALLYYGLVTPIGLCLRLLGRDPLAKQANRECGSYWEPHPVDNDPRRYSRMY